MREGQTHDFRKLGNPWDLRLFPNIKDPRRAIFSGLHGIYYFLAAVNAIAAGKNAAYAGQPVGINIILP